MYPDSDSALDEAIAGAGDGARLRQTLTLVRDWRAPADSVSLAPEYRIGRDAAGPRVDVRLGEHDLCLDEPIALEPAHVPKPWGQEIWHTGIEARGESAVVTCHGELPLSQYLALAPRRLCRRAPLVLLKVLDPLPQPVLGDLYFEVHREKQEVYVVTHVSPEAWPDGRGGIRFGMNQDLRRRYGNDAAFRRDYLAAVRAYERVRRAIDAGEVVAAAREAELRANMERFTAMRPLAVGDVVAVPTWLPHSLQHGVRVIEFQTPTYERYILSFAQKVRTQDHWDTADAVPHMRLDAPAEPEFARLDPGVERIVAFDDFRVWRVALAPGEQRELPEHPSYLVCMAVQGEVTLGELRLGPEQAAFVPASALEHPLRRRRDGRLTNAGASPATVLLAAPDL